MKWMIASDIHGAAGYCRTMLERYDEEEAERLILLGDLLYHGPRNDLPEEYDPKQVIEMLNAGRNFILCVRGNCEAEVDQMVLKFPVLAEYALMPAGSNLIYITHGHHASEQSPPPHAPGDILLAGHTHVAKCEKHEDYVYMNPGSVALPKDGSRRSYMTFDGNAFIWKDLETAEPFMQYELAQRDAGNE